MVIISLLGLIFLILWLVLRFIPWSNFTSKHEQSTVLIVTAKVDQTGAYLVRFDAASLRITVHPVNADQTLNVWGGYGEYRLQAIYPLLALEGKSPAEIRSIFSLSTGVLLDELWPIDASRLELNNRAQWQAFLLAQLLKKSPLPLTEKLNWLALAADQRTSFEVRPTVSDWNSLALALPDYSQPQLACTVALINTTQLTGLANKMATLLESHNFRVVRTVSDTAPVDQTIMIMADQPPEDCDSVIGALGRILPGGFQEQQDETVTLRQRADLVVRLGSDLGQ